MVNYVLKTSDGCTIEMRVALSNYLSSMGLSGGRVLSSTQQTSKVMNRFLPYQIIIEIHFHLEI